MTLRQNVIAKITQAVAPSAESAAPEGASSTLFQPSAARFWLAVLLTGVGAGLSAVALTLLWYEVQRLVWSAPSSDILAAAARAPPSLRLLALLGAGVLTGAAQFALVSLSSANAIEITTALWFYAGRLPPLRTVASAILSIVIVAMGASLGREGAPKQMGAVIANLLADRAQFSDQQRKLIVACGAGAGIAAVYNVPLGGALFALEVLRGVLSVRLALPALGASLVATIVAHIFLPDRPLYSFTDGAASASVMLWAAIAGPVFGLASVGYVRMIALADRIRPSGWQRLVAPALALGLLGALSIPFPQLLGNGQDLTQSLLNGAVPSSLFVVLLILKPFATFICLGSGAPGGLFTPSLTFGALLGAFLGSLWLTFWPGAPPGAFAVLGAGAVLAATTQGPISASVLMMELTGRDQAFIAPLLLAIVAASAVARSIEIRSIYDARLSDAQLTARRHLRENLPQ